SQRLAADGIQAAVRLWHGRKWFPKQIAEGWLLYGTYRPRVEGEWVENARGEERTYTPGGGWTAGLPPRAEGVMLTDDGAVLDYRGDYPAFYARPNTNGLTTKILSLPTPRYDRLDLRTHESFLDPPERLLDGLASLTLRYYHVTDSEAYIPRSFNPPV
ncbi:MAG TPA: hypothetical protein VLF62_02375, partial [Candidatus Saccharimonadales bacterium]|nr:hypothetical protein [Candidatus Saccharimonadales bacterium]